MFRLLRKWRKKITTWYTRKHDYLLGVEDSAVEDPSMAGGLKRSLKRWDATKCEQFYSTKELDFQGVSPSALTKQISNGFPGPRR
jgi:hypothetical protein